MTSLWFVVPAHGRLEMAGVCLRQLRRTCDALADYDIDATAVVVASDENLDTARDLGFATVERENHPLGRKWNDGYQLACDPALNPEPTDYVIPLGSDDWVDAEWIAEHPLPAADEVRCARLSSIVREDGQRLQRLNIRYEGGDGVRIFPASLFESLRYRPAEEDRSRAIDTSVFRRLGYVHGGRPGLVYHDTDHLQIVDFKSRTGQLNEYEDCRQSPHTDGPEEAGVWELLAERYPVEAVTEMMRLHERGLVAA